MALTPAERSRRYRARKKAEQSGLVVPLDQRAQGRVADFLVEKKTLSEWDSDNREALGIAIAEFMKDLAERA